MRKYIQIYLLLLLFPLGLLNAQHISADDEKTKVDVPLVKGYYQTINLDAETPCNCNEKTQRTHDLAKGLIPNDVVNYKLQAYKFTFGNSTVGVSKLFKAFEEDKSIYKVSMKEWDSFMLLTTDKFDVSSFEAAAKLVFATFEPIPVEDYLLRKNSASYTEYMKFIQQPSTDK